MKTKTLIFFMIAVLVFMVVVGCCTDSDSNPYKKDRNGWGVFSSDGREFHNVRNLYMYGDFFGGSKYVMFTTEDGHVAYVTGSFTLVKEEKN